MLCFVPWQAQATAHRRSSAVSLLGEEFSVGGLGWRRILLYRRANTVSIDAARDRRIPWCCMAVYDAAHDRRNMFAVCLPDGTL